LFLFNLIKNSEHAHGKPAISAFAVRYVIEGARKYERKMAFSVSALDAFLRRGDQAVESLSDGVKDLKKMTSEDSNVILPKNFGQKLK